MRVPGIGLAALAWAGLQATPLAAALPSVGLQTPPPAHRPPNASQAAPSHETPAAAHRAVLDRYCVTCHNERLRTADLALDVANLERVRDDAATWEKVARKLRTRTMPPSPRPRPDDAAYDGLASWLESELDRAAVDAPNPGRPPSLHRLNRTEYANAVRDLLALEVDAAAFLPPDDASYGFDNIGDILRVSPTLLEGYLDAARVISAHAVGDTMIALEEHTHRVAPDLTQDYGLEGLPFGTRGGTRIDRYFPVDGEYLIQVRLQRNFIGGRIAGLREPHELEITIDGDRIELFTVGPKKKAPADGDDDDDGDDDEDDDEEGEDDEDDDDGEDDQDRVAAPSNVEDDAPLDAGLNVRVPIAAGLRSIGVTFLDRPAAQAEDTRLPYLRSFAVLADTSGGGMPHIDTVTLTGPYDARVGDTPSRDRIFVCEPATEADEPGCVRQIVATLARRAYRRPVTTAEVATLVDFYEAARADGRGFEAGVQRALQRLLVSPDFIFRIEHEPADAEPDSIYRISDLELASRLSFFLWSSAPDDELLAMAEAGRLRVPGVLDQQVARMLRDQRAQALVANFAGQWLYLRNVPHTIPDARRFPDFDDNLRAAMRRETELLFETIAREDRSALELLTARYTFVNERLARHYGIPNVYGSHFRRIDLADDSPRGGLLGQASILMVTSYPNRTSPVLRGKWLLENILGSPPPDPPADVPPLEESSGDGHAQSMREQMLLHRANPVCASCHKVMDPLGFALENFDAVGAWRATDADTPIDATGALPSGVPFDGPRELREALLRDPALFVEVVTERLLTYALGRGVEYYDHAAIRAIGRAAARDDYRFSSLIQGIVESVPFQMRRTQS